MSRDSCHRLSSVPRASSVAKKPELGCSLQSGDNVIFLIKLQWKQQRVALMSAGSAWCLSGRTGGSRHCCFCSNTNKILSLPPAPRGVRTRGNSGAWSRVGTVDGRELKAGAERLGSQGQYRAAASACSGPGSWPGCDCPLRPVLLAFLPKGQGNPDQAKRCCWVVFTVWAAPPWPQPP